MNKKIKIIIGIIFTIIILSISGFFFVHHLITKSFPVVDRTLTIEGLQKPVTILRDDYGVPHIFAENEHDLFFAQGFTHAQDRLWQMDIARRAGQGRLSEILGTSTIEFDKLFRTLGFGQIAKKIEQNLHPESQKILQAYSDGVNAFITSHKGKYPLEFDMLNYTPEEWKPIHSILITRLMAWELNISWYADITLGKLVEKFGKEKAQEVFPTYPENAPLIIPKNFSQQKISSATSFLEITKSYKEYFGKSGTHIGSNAWVVAPQKSLSGKPILANDPHLHFSIPAKWYQIHLNGGEYDVAGVSIPGAPCVVIGFTPAITWGVTAMMADDADFYLEQTDSLHPQQYFYKNSWLPITIIEDTIIVKDSSNISFTIQSTHHGPIINNLRSKKATPNVPIAFRWTGQEISDEVYAISLINKAKNWNEFRKGVQHFSVPGQNFVFADSAGNIGYQSGVKLPQRPLQHPTLPFPGWTDEYEWKGFVPFEKLPTMFNPPEHYIATANNKISEKFPYHISNLWEPPSRIQRIQELLNAQEKFSVQDFKKMQLDEYSYFAKELTPYILHAYDSVAIVNPNIKNALQYFRNWNFITNKGDVTTTIFHVWFTKLLENIFKNKMEKELYEEYIFLANITYRVIPSLFNNPTSSWFDEPQTSQIETRDEIIRKSLEQALEELQKNNSEIKTQQWEKFHTLTLKHPLSKKKPLDKLFNLGPFSVGGTGTSINNGEYSFIKPYEVALGPSMRTIVDLGNINNTFSVLPVGQSGQVFHKNYSDQTPLWLNGTYHTIPISKNIIEKNTKYKLLLEPK